MAVDEKVAVGGVLVLADAALDQRRLGERRETAGEEIARGRPAGGATAPMRYVAPAATISFTRVSTARRAITAPLAGSSCPAVMSSSEICGYRFASSSRERSSTRPPARRIASRLSRA